MHILKILKERELCCMDKEYYDILAKVRIERTGELLDEAIELLEKGHINLQITGLFMLLKKV